VFPSERLAYFILKMKVALTSSHVVFPAQSREALVLGETVSDHSRF